MSLLHVIIFLFIGFLVFTIDKKQDRFPVPMVLLLVGFALSYFAFFSGVRPTHELVHDWLLPAVLFTAAYQFNTKWLKKNAKVIILISTIGLISATLLLGASIYWLGLASLSFAGSLVVAAILMPSDSVSVIEIQKEADMDKKVEEIVEGESLASDGMSTVIFTTVAAMFLMNEPFQPGSFLLDFVVQAGGGLLVGAAIGWLSSLFVHHIRHHHYQVMLSILIAYVSFYIAESLHMAGLLATISAGLFLSHWMRKSEHEKEYRSYLDGFWEVLEPSILSILYLLIGAEFLSFFQWQHALAAIAVFFLMLLIRFLMIWSIGLLSSAFRRDVSLLEQMLMTFSGIKGSVSIALLLSIAAAETDTPTDVLSIAFGVIFLSVTLQSVIVYPLSKLATNSNE